jgi:hypothetical protein
VGERGRTGGRFRASSPLPLPVDVLPNTQVNRQPVGDQSMAVDAGEKTLWPARSGPAVLQAGEEALFTDGETGGRRT